MPQEAEKPMIEQVPASPERSLEAPPTPGAFESPAAEAAPTPMPAPSAPAPAAAPAPSRKDPTLVQVEQVLEKDVEEAYRKMDPSRRKKFRAEGEKVAAVAVRMIRSAKANARVLLKLIGDWLKIIPGVNRFFLAQSAKIKTDRILELAEKAKNPNGGL